MKAFFLVAAFSCGAAFAGVWYATSQATPVISEARLRTLSTWCEVGEEEACRLLATETGGQCAGPSGSGCRYDDAVFLMHHETMQ